MQERLLVKDTGIYECAVLCKKVNQLIDEISKNEVLHRDLSDKVFTIKYFLFKEMGCLKGIVREQIEKNETKDKD